MYGMVNEGIRSFIVKNFGESKWVEISKRAGIKENDFILMKVYPDKMTYDLVGAVSEVLQLPPESVLEEYGKYWISFASHAGYENLLVMFGSDVRSSLQNLNHMHEHMGTFMTDIMAPGFKVLEESEKEIIVEYSSKRQGLTPFVKGLMHGLLLRFEEKGTVEYLGYFGENARFKIIFS